MAKRYPPLPPSNPGGKRIVVPLKAAGTTSKKTPPLRPSGRGLKRTSPLPAARETAPYELFTEDVISGMPRTEEARSLEPTEFVFGPDSIPIQPTRLIRPTQRLGFRLPGATFWPFQWIDQTCRDVLDQSGLKAIRTDFFWDDRRGYGDEYTLDTVMKEARERKIDVLAIADDEYREDTHEYNYTNPETIAKLKEHCRYLADRYKPRGALAQREQWGDDFGVRYWQIGNEENHPTKPYPFAYLRLFRACVEGIREADPDAKIVMGGLWGRFCGGYDDPHSPRNYLDWLFEDDFFRDNVDVIAIHPYRRPATPDNAVRDQFEREQFCTLEKELRSLKDFVDARSPRDLPIWITEIGWHTDEDYQGEFRAAKCMTRSFNIMLDLPFVKRVYWFNLMHSTEEHFRHFEFHLFRSDATATQAGEVLRWPPSRDGFPSSSTTGYTGLQRENMTQRAYFKGRLSAGDRLSAQGFTSGRRPPGGSQWRKNYETDIDVFGPTESEEPDFNWDTIGEFDRNESTVAFTVRSAGTYIVALRPIPDWEPRYYHVRFSVRSSSR